MTIATMPMFPLGMTLLPGGVLPLHVFEPRYRAMVYDLLAADAVPEFGQVLITRGREVGGDDVRSPVGTVGQIVQIEALDGGRYALVALGTRRIRVRSWMPDDPYPRAEVEDWPDDAAEPASAAAGGADRSAVGGAQLAAAAERVARLRTLAVRADRESERDPGQEASQSGHDAEPDAASIELPDDAVLASYHLATLAPIGAADRYRLLAAPGPASRIALLDEILDDVEAALRFRLS